MYHIKLFYLHTHLKSREGIIFLRRIKEIQEDAVHDGVTSFKFRGARETSWRESWRSSAWKMTRHMAKQSYSVSIGKGGYANGENCLGFLATCHRCHVYFCSMNSISLCNIDPQVERQDR